MPGIPIRAEPWEDWLVLGLGWLGLEIGLDLEHG